MMTNDMGVIRAPRKPRKRKPLVSDYQTTPPKLPKKKTTTVRPNGDNYQKLEQNKIQHGGLGNPKMSGGTKSAISSFNKKLGGARLKSSPDDKRNYDTTAQALRPNPAGTSTNDKAMLLADQFRKAGGFNKLKNTLKK